MGGEQNSALAGRDLLVWVKGKDAGFAERASLAPAYIDS